MLKGIPSGCLHTDLWDSNVSDEDKERFGGPDFVASCEDAAAAVALVDQSHDRRNGRAQQRWQEELLK